MVSIVEFVILSKAKDLFRFFGLCPQNDNVFMQAVPCNYTATGGCLQSPIDRAFFRCYNVFIAPDDVDWTKKSPYQRLEEDLGTEDG